MPTRRYSRLFPVLFLLIDLAFLNVSLAISNYYSFREITLVYPNYQNLHILLNIVWISVYLLSKLHEIDRNQRLIDHLNKVLTGLVINLSVVFAAWFVFQPEDYSRRFLFYTFLAFSIGLLIWRTIWHYTIRYYRAKGYNIRNVLFLGGGHPSTMLASLFKEEPEMGYRLVESMEGGAPDFEKVHTLVKERGIDVVFCYLPSFSDLEIRRIIDYAENNLIRVNLISQFSELANYSLAIEQVGNVPIIKVNSIPLDNLSNRFIKRAFDILFSSLVLITVMSWLIPLIGLLIKLESKGPIFFKQKRHGKNNSYFVCWKFRTMTHSPKSEFKQATKNDNRITKIGAILRKTSIDELPQFINVFLGDMSVVGPRPHPIKLNEEFSPKIDKFWQRHAVKPGITGLAQAKGFRGETAELRDMSGRVKLDRFYVKNWSLIFDFKIIILTILSIVRGDENAY